MKAPIAGHWITVHGGHHVFIKGASVDPGHVAAVATMHGVPDDIHKDLIDAHAKGQIENDHQLHTIAAEVGGAAAVGFDARYALKTALAAHGTVNPTPSSSLTHKPVTITTTQIWQEGKGKKKGTHVPVMTLGHATTPEEAKAYAKQFGFDSKATNLLISAVSKGQISIDHSLAQAVGDTAHVSKMTGLPHLISLAALLSGKPATQIIADNMVASVVPAPTPVPLPGVTPIPPTTHAARDHVTLQGKKFNVDPHKPVTSADVDALASQIKVTANGVAAMKDAITSGQVKSHGHLMEVAAIAQASANGYGFTSLNGPGFTEALKTGSLEALLDSAHSGDASAQSIVSKLGAHSFSSPVAKAAAANAAKVAQAKSVLGTQFVRPIECVKRRIPRMSVMKNGLLYCHILRF